MMVGAWGPSREEQGMTRKDPDRIGPRGTTWLKNGSKNKAETPVFHLERPRLRGGSSRSSTMSAAAQRRRLAIWLAHAAKPVKLWYVGARRHDYGQEHRLDEDGGLENQECSHSEPDATPENVAPASSETFRQGNRA
jgi:hypothetical protein